MKEIMSKKNNNEIILYQPDDTPRLEVCKDYLHTTKHGVVSGKTQVKIGELDKISTVPILEIIQQEGSFQKRRRKSCKDETILTVDFNLRTRNTTHSLQVPQGRHYFMSKVSSLRDLETMLYYLLRRLKPTVNKVLSLRDIFPLTQHYYKLIISHS